MAGGVKCTINVNYILAHRKSDGETIFDTSKGIRKYMVCELMYRRG